MCYRNRNISSIYNKIIANMNPDLIIHSIEIWDVPYKESINYTADYNNIKLYHNNSVEQLKKLLPTIEEEYVLFYLDAHWHDNWPILEELKIISENFFDRAIIIIYDFFCTK